MYTRKVHHLYRAPVTHKHLLVVHPALSCRIRYLDKKCNIGAFYRQYLTISDVGLVDIRAFMMTKRMVSLEPYHYYF